MVKVPKKTTKNAQEPAADNQSFLPYDKGMLQNEQIENLYKGLNNLHASEEARDGGYRRSLDELSTANSELNKRMGELEKALDSERSLREKEGGGYAKKGEFDELKENVDGHTRELGEIRKHVDFAVEGLRGYVDLVADAVNGALNLVYGVADAAKEILVNVTGREEDVPAVDKIDDLLEQARDAEKDLAKHRGKNEVKKS